MNKSVSEAQLINTVNRLTRSQINTLICIPSINNAYLLELAVISQYPNLVAALINNGSNVCLTSDEYGRSLYAQLTQLGSNLATPINQQIIGILVQNGGASCGY
jgi:hypothetical protein